MHADRTPLRVALLDLNNGHANQGMRCLRAILAMCDGRFGGTPIVWDEFDVRQRAEVPDLSYDVFLSSGGPGSPYDGEGSLWEHRYFTWLDALVNHNARPGVTPKRAFLICHSFELAVRHFRLANLTERKSESFGIFPVHKTEAGRADRIFRGLADPFFAADFRSWQIIEPDETRMHKLGMEVLALEKERPHVDLEQAIMALRFSPYIVGTQFHPEADPDGMQVHFRAPERRAAIIAKHGLEKYERIMHRIGHPRFLARTHANLLPHFLQECAHASTDFAATRAA